METGEAVKSILTHHGIKGMRWGVRRRNIGTSSEVTVKTTPSKMAKTKIRTSGGAGRPAHADAVAARTTEQILKRSGSHALANDVLQTLALRLNLERSVKQASSATSPVKSFVAKTLSNVAKQQANAVASDAAAKHVANLLKKTHKVATS